MVKIAIIGAGSIVFCKTLILDIMATEGLGEIEFALMAPSMNRIPHIEAFMKKVIEKHQLPIKVWCTNNRREALAGAKYVICALQVGGMAVYESDYQIPLRYGVDQCIGDTLAPGGIMRAQRSIPVMLDMAADMKELCPQALLLNYVNPMAMVCWALGTTGISFVGLCHGVQTTLDLISGYVGVAKEKIAYTTAGINHMAWFLKIESEGKDLYPVLKENFEKPEFYANEKVRGEVFRHFGYFMTESTGHLSEYLPWFRGSRAALDLYCDEPEFGGESGAHIHWLKKVANKMTDSDVLKNTPAALPNRSVEYCSYIIEAMETGRTFTFNGNVRNDGMIANLPLDCCTEGPMIANQNGLHKTIVGELPPQLAALNMSNITVQRLGVLAAMNGDTELLCDAMAMDPLTARVLTLREVREMVSELLESQREWLPQFEGKSVRRVDVISIPKHVQRVPVPLDPALAIAARFGELVKE